MIILHFQIFSFERFVPVRWYRKTNEALKKFRLSILAKIPRISITTNNLNDRNQKTTEHNYEEKDGIGPATEPTLENMDKGKGKGKGKGKSSNRMEKFATKIEK